MKVLNQLLKNMHWPICRLYNLLTRTLLRSSTLSSPAAERGLKKLLSNVIKLKFPL